MLNFTPRPRARLPALHAVLQMLYEAPGVALQEADGDQPDGTSGQPVCMYLGDGWVGGWMGWGQQLR